MSTGLVLAWVCEISDSRPETKPWKRAGLIIGLVGAIRNPPDEDD